MFVLKCQLVGYKRIDYVKDGKDQAFCELHFIRNPFSSESEFEGNVTRKYSVFGIKACDALPDLIVGGLYSVDTEVSGKYENLVEMQLLSAPK